MRWRPTFSGHLDPGPQRPPLGGSAVVTSHCSSSPGFQLCSSLVLRSQHEALSAVSLNQQTTPLFCFLFTCITYTDICQIYCMRYVQLLSNLILSLLVLVGGQYMYWSRPHCKVCVYTHSSWGGGLHVYISISV